MIIGNIIIVIDAQKSLGRAIAWSIGADLIPLIFVLAGIRLWQGQGRVAGTAVALILLLDLALFGSKPTLILSAAMFGPELSSVVSATMLIIRAVIFLLIINGVRGVLASRSTHWTKKRVEPNRATRKSDMGRNQPLPSARP